jgi:rod shape-determining protein MreD
MMLVEHHGGWVIILTFLIALLLTLLPVPVWASPYRPEWVILVLMYWSIALPERVGIGSAWVLGLLLDTVKGSLLGEHALSLSLVAYTCLKLHRHLRVYPLWQQSLGVLLLVMLSQLLSLSIRGLSGPAPAQWHYWSTSIASMLLWPWLFIVMRDLRRRFRVT